MAVRQEIHQHRIPGKQLPLKDRLSPHDFARRQVIREFTMKSEDPRSFATVMRYVGKFVDQFEERFNEDDTPIFQGWHALRVEMLDIPLNTPDYAKVSKAKTDAFIKTFFTKLGTEEFDENKYFRVQPVIKEITYLVSKGN
ncbi:MAG: hypothetical protein ABSE17_04285 [Candidatus Levyibacteriota bacterium]|jgi:hypothetical protein